MSQDELRDGLTVTFHMRVGSRREGFEHLRDLITRHRRGWSLTYLDPYLRARWETELSSTATEYSRLLEEKGRPLTLKQFAKTAQAATNHWFGGDVSGLYAAIGERVPERPQRVCVMPADPLRFAWTVFQALGGQSCSRQILVRSHIEADAQAQKAQRHGHLLRLAELSVWYVQLEEALGRPPELREFGHAKFAWPSAVLTADMEQAWAMFQEAIATAKQSVEAHASSPQLTLSAQREPPPTASEPTPLPVSGKKNRSFWQRLLTFASWNHT